MSHRIIAAVTALSVLAGPAFAQQPIWGGTAQPHHPGAWSHSYVPHDPKDDEWSTTTKVIVGSLIAIMAYGILSGDSGAKPASGGNSSADLEERLQANRHGSGGSPSGTSPTERSYGLYGTDHCVGRC